MLLPAPTSCYQHIDKRQVTSQLVPFIPKVLPSPPFPLARGNESVQGLDEENLPSTLPSSSSPQELELLPRQDSEVV